MSDPRLDELSDRIDRIPGAHAVEGVRLAVTLSEEDELPDDQHAWYIVQEMYASGLEEEGEIASLSTTGVEFRAAHAGGPKPATGKVVLCVPSNGYYAFTT